MELHPVDLDQYARRRKALRPHSTALVKKIASTTLRQCAKKLGMFDGENFLVETEGEMTILLDYCIYSHLQHGRPLIQKYLAKLPASPNPDEQQVRSAMAQDRFSIYRIDRTQPGTGLVVTDRVRGGTLFVVDTLLSTTARPGQFLGGRLLPFPEYWITSGAAFPVSKEAEGMIQNEFLAGVWPNQGDLSTLTPEVHEALAAAVIQAAFLDGTTANVEYPPAAPPRKNSRQKQAERVMAILGENDYEFLDQAVDVFFRHLQARLQLPCEVKGSDYFVWEKPYAGTSRGKAEYEQLKQTQPSYRDTYELLSISQGPATDWMMLDDDIIAHVRRIGDGKEFDLGLAELRVADRKSPNHQLIDDYAMWFAVATALG